MSLYFFFLAMGYLNRALKTLQYKPDFDYHPRCARKNSAHIYFADDLILCCRADKVSIQLLLERFNYVSDVFGLTTNMEKSSLYINGVT